MVSVLKWNEQQTCQHSCFRFIKDVNSPVDTQGSLLPSVGGVEARRALSEYEKCVTHTHTHKHPHTRTHTQTTPHAETRTNTPMKEEDPARRSLAGPHNVLGSAGFISSFSPAGQKAEIEQIKTHAAKTVAKIAAEWSADGHALITSHRLW